MSHLVVESSVIPVSGTWKSKCNAKFDDSGYNNSLNILRSMTNAQMSFILSITSLVITADQLSVTCIVKI